jgi:hypothetical protein
MSLVIRSILTAVTEGKTLVSEKPSSVKKLNAPFQVLKSPFSGLVIEQAEALDSA